MILIALIACNMDTLEVTPRALVVPESLDEAPIGNDGPASDASNIEEVGIVTLTDLDTKNQVSLESFGDWTLVTNLDTEETLDVDGDITGEWDDDSYTEMMREKRIMAEARADDGDLQWALSGSGVFSISSSYTTPEYAKTGTTAVKTTMSNLKTYDTSSNAIRIELKRAISWWPDATYGTQEYWVDYNGGSVDRDAGGTKTWSSANVAASYYLVITRNYNLGRWTTGNFALSD